jgi:hypothetical protein
LIYKNRLLFGTLLVLLLLPIGYLASLSVQLTRPEQVGYQFFSKDGVEYVTCSQLLSDASIKWSTLAIDGEPKSTSGNWFSTKKIKPKSNAAYAFSYLSDDGRGFEIYSGDGSSILYEYELYNDKPVKVTDIEFLAPVSYHQSDFNCVCNGRLVRMTADQLELRDVSTGEVLDAVPLQMVPKSFICHVPYTQSFLVVDNSSAILRKYDVSGDKLNLIQEWSMVGLHMIAFHRNNQTFIANLLPDGKTIEVRNVIDGSVVGSSTSNCPAPVSQIPFPSKGFDSLNGFLYWKSLRIWTDVYTGKSLAIPPSFEPFVREADGNRIVAIRHQEMPNIVECIIVDTSTDEELLRVRVDPSVRVKAARILKKSGNFALITDDFRVLIYDFETGNLIRIIDPFEWAFWLSCAAAILFAIWCVVFLSFAATIRMRGWVDVGLCIGLLIAYATVRFNEIASWHSAEVFFGPSQGVLMGSILLTSIWLCLGRSRMFLRTAPVILAFGLAAGLIDRWLRDPDLKDFSIAILVPWSLSVMLPLVILRWIGVRFENLNQTSKSVLNDRKQRESSINLRDIFLFMTVSAIVASIVRWIPRIYWYGTWLHQPSVRSSMFFVAVQAAGLAAIGLLAMWTSLSRRKFVIRWSPWLIVVVVLLFVNLPFDLRPMLIGALPTILLGLHAYRLRGLRFAITQRLPSQVGAPASAG